MKAGSGRGATACFSGHRPEKLLAGSSQEIRRRLGIAVERAVRDGYTRFISGMSRGVDMWAAEAVLELRKREPAIELECALPYDGQQEKWSAGAISEYSAILEQADVVTCLSPVYNTSCMSARNAYMVGRSSRLIACYDGHTPGGTANTVRMAVRGGLDIENIWEGGGI